MHRERDIATVRNVDVVTAGTRGVMSGTYAVLSIPITQAKGPDHPEKVYLNGVPGHILHSMNDRSRNMDIMVFGGAVSKYDPRSGGGHLFREIVRRKKIWSR